MAMQHKFTRTFHDCTQDQIATSRGRITSLVALANALHEEGDLVGADKVHSLVDHLRSEIDFLTDKTCRVLDEDFMRGIAA